MASENDACRGETASPAIYAPEEALRHCDAQNSTETEGLNPLYVPPGLSNGNLGKQCEGLDPMEIDPAVLTAAGHPPRRTSAVVAAYKKVMGGDIFAVEFARIKRHKHIRAYCKTCVENEAEVRRCTTFWCPFWPYRMGCNPHNPQRGKIPFAERGSARSRIKEAS
jgi:hypothetical protein